MIVDDPWNQPPKPPPEPTGPVQPSVSHKVGCMLGAGGCFGVVVLLCAFGILIGMVGQRLDNIEKKLGETKPADTKKNDK